MRLTPADVHRLADLARLHVSDDEAAEFAAQLGDILSRVDGLREPGPTGAAGARQDGGRDRQVLRADHPGPDPLADASSEFAPGWSDGFFTVPRLPSHGPTEEGP